MKTATLKKENRLIYLGNLKAYFLCLLIIGVSHFTFAQTVVSLTTSATPNRFGLLVGEQLCELIVGLLPTLTTKGDFRVYI